MAHHASAKKRVRQSKRRTLVNRARLSAIRSSFRKVEEAIASGDKASAEAAFKSFEPKMARGAQKGVVQRNLDARKLSRLSERIRVMAA